MDIDKFSKNIWDWAIEFGFIIDGNNIIIENLDVEGFINVLDNQFNNWNNQKSQNKKGE